MQDQAQYRPGESLQIEAAKNGFIVYTNEGNFVANSMDQLNTFILLHLTTAADLMGQQVANEHEEVVNVEPYVVDDTEAAA